MAIEQVNNAILIILSALLLGVLWSIVLIIKTAIEEYSISKKQDYDKI